MSSEFPDSSKSMLARLAAHSLAAIATSWAPSSTRNSSSMPNCLAKLVVIPWRKFPMLMSVPNTTRFSWRARLTSDSHSAGAAHQAKFTARSETTHASKNDNGALSSLPIDFSRAGHLFDELRPALFHGLFVFRRKDIGLGKRIAPMERFAGVDKNSSRRVRAGRLLRGRQTRIEIFGPHRF